jgi:hypothetical protein
MKSSTKSTWFFYVALCSLLFAFIAELRSQTEPSDTVVVSSSAEKGLFDSDDILHITLSKDKRQLSNDKSNDSKDYPMVLYYANDDSAKVAIPVAIKDRGNFRRLHGNCEYLPLMIYFPKTGEHSGTLFHEQKKMKLVMPCRDEKYVVREWLVYKIYNLITPKSFKARLVKVTMADKNNKSSAPPFYGILLEEEKQMAKRNGLVAVERKLKPYQVQKDAFLSMAVFEYLIGNTDWSIQYQQNIKLLAQDSMSVPTAVPYDFDHAGIVSAPYALPAAELKMKSVRQRRYRGYCPQNLKKFEPVIELFNQLKPDIYRLYTACTYLDPEYIESTVKYLDEFYATINDPRAWQAEFTYPCDPKGTGNVVVKGLKE